jgi:hypothetical protein
LPTSSGCSRRARQSVGGSFNCQRRLDAGS